MPPCASRFLMVIAFSASVLIPESSSGLEYAASVGYSGEYSDNASRTSEEESDFVHRPGFDFSGSHSGPSVDLGFGYSAHRRMYDSDTFRDETVLEGGADVAWNVVPGRLVVFAANHRQETEIRRSGEAVPSNLQEASDSQAGLNLIIDSFSNHYLTLGYLYSETHFARAGSNSGRHNASAAYSIPVSVTDVLSLIGSATRVNFDDPAAPDYESRSGSVQYQRQTTRTSASLRLGYQEVDRELRRDTVDGYTGAFAWTRQLSPTSSFGVSYSQDLRDNSLEFGRRLVGEEADIIDEPGFVGDTDISEVYTEKRAGAHYGTLIGANSLVVSVNAARRRYDDVERDTDYRSLSVDVGRAIRPTLNARLALSYRQNEFEEFDELGEFDETAQKDDEVRASLQFSWQRTPRLSLGWGLAYFTRDRDREELGQRDVDDWYATVSVDYLVFATAFR